MMNITNEELRLALNAHTKAILEYLGCLQEEEAAKVKVSAMRVKMMEAEEAITDLRQRLTTTDRLV